jgi:transposase
MSNTKINYIGVDLHKKTCFITIMDKMGKIKRQTEISSDENSVLKFFKKHDTAKVAVESTMNWIPFYESLESLNIDVSLSNPLQTKAIASAKIKNDKVDSKVLADLLRTNLLPRAYIQPQNIRDLKELVRERANFVETRTRIKNKIHSVLFKTNNRHTFTNLYGKTGMKWLKELELRDVYRQELNRYLETLDHLNEQVDKISSVIEKTAKLDFDCQLLMTIPGISYYSALMIKSEIGDIARFSNANKLCSYAGLIPSTYASADKIRTGRITKRGSKWLRMTIVNAVTSGSRNHNRIGAFYKKLKKNKGTGKAKVAASRKLCSVIFAILNDQVPFKNFAPVKKR